MVTLAEWYDNRPQVLFGVSRADYDALYARQGGKCAGCGAEGHDDFPWQKRTKLYVAGTRLVCGLCNVKSKLGDMA